MPDYPLQTSRNQKSFGDGNAIIISEISSNQSALKIAETNVAYAQRQLTNQFEKLTNVESLVNALYANTEDENISTSDTNKLLTAKAGGVLGVIVRLNYVPIPNSIQGILQHNGTQIPLIPKMFQDKNVLFFQFPEQTDLSGGVIMFRYIKNSIDTLVATNVMLAAILINPPQPTLSLPTFQINIDGKKYIK